MARLYLRPSLSLVAQGDIATILKPFVSSENSREPRLRHQSILVYERFRWLKVATALCLASGVAYLVHEPATGAYGGTWLGYSLGTLGALLIGWLLWFGVRKRRYASTLGTVQGWLSAHVYLGASLLVIVTLHTGFQVGWNVHTLTYVLMVVVVLSGLYGVYAYNALPEEMTANRAGATIEALLARIGDIDRELRSRALGLPDSLLTAVNASIDRTRLGGSAWRLLTGEDRGCPTAAALQALSVAGTTPDGESSPLHHDVFALVAEKNELLRRARRDLSIKARLELWLYLHVPLSLGLLGALIAHVVSVFLYW